MRESEMFEPFWCWLLRVGRVRSGSVFVRELPWLGRRVDLATLTASGSLTAYEFKVDNNLRAIEQASYNAHAFHRSYVVTMTVPSSQNLEIAVMRGVGVIALSSTDEGVRTICRAQPQASSGASGRLRDAIRAQGCTIDV